MSNIGLVHCLLPPPFPVDFPDKRIEAAIREAIGKAEGVIYSDEVRAIGRLAPLSGANITSLSGLEECQRLSRLELPFNQITDVSPLAYPIISGLNYLDLSSNQISDVSPLAGHT